MCSIIAPLVGWLVGLGIAFGIMALFAVPSVVVAFVVACIFGFGLSFAGWMLGDAYARGRR